MRPAFLALTALLACSPAHARQTPPDLELHFFDVRQGDAALIITPARQHVLIDAGPNPRAVAARLRAMRVDTVDLVVASHAHADHIGGMAAVVRGFAVRFYMDNGRAHPTQTYDRLLSAVESSRATYLEATPRTLTLRDSVLVRVLPPAPDARDQNDQSVGLTLGFGGFNAVFTGDAEHAARRLWLATGNLPRASVLKVAHHGAENASDSGWIAALRPCVAVISVGAGNRYGHPSPRTIALLERAGARVFRTDVHGDIIISARRDGGMRVRTTRGPAAAAADTSAIRCAA